VSRRSHNWLSDVWRTDLDTVLNCLGLEPEKKGDYYLCLCPSCNEKRAFVYEPKSDSDAPTMQCNRANNCGFESRIYDMVCENEGTKEKAHSYLKSLSGSSKPRTYAIVRPEPRLIRPPKNELQDLWSAGAQMPEDDHPFMKEAKELLKAKGSSLDAALDMGRVTLPFGPFPRWWPHGQHWIMVKAFNYQGDWESVHGRSVFPGTKNKSAWPRGYKASGLVFGSRYEQAFLRGEVDDAPFIAITEGLTDWVRLRTLYDSNPEERKAVVLGITSGSHSAIKDIQWPRQRLRVFIMTDRDAKGIEYANKIAELLPSHLTPLREEDEEDEQ